MSNLLSFSISLAVLFAILFSCNAIAANRSRNKYTNIVLIGAAGSGKGTQGDLIKKDFNLLKISAGDVLRAYRQDKNAKHTATINSLIDKGQLVPSEIVNEIIGEYMDKEVFKNKKSKYKGILFDGYPRQVAQLEFLDKFLASRGSKINLVVYINIAESALVERLAGRFSCAKCGEIYHKKTKPTKVDGVCDVCGHTHFVSRADDADESAIRSRFDLFRKETKPVLDLYMNHSAGLVFEVDGDKAPNDIYLNIKKKLETL